MPNLTTQIQAWVNAHQLTAYKIGGIVSDCADPNDKARKTITERWRRALNGTGSLEAILPDLEAMEYRVTIQIDKIK